jgi:outer membrane immunogenic protein
MNRWNAAALSAIAMVSGLTATQASAQIQLRGVRADASVALDRFYSEGNNDNQLGYGASIGVDTFVSPTFVLGIEGTFLNSRAENITRDGPGVAERKSFEEYGAAVRAGVMMSPSTLLYAKGGFVVNEQRKYFNRDAVATPGIPNNTAFGDYYNHYRTKGYVIGGGVEQMLSDRFYVKAEGRYANYKTNSSRVTGLLGIGVLFGPSAEVVEIAPPPPPPPPVEVAPATQTCADGSVILATEVCPAPAPYVPPAPPEAAPERG